MRKNNKKYIKRPPRVFISKSGKLYIKLNSKTVKINSNIKNIVKIRNIVNTMQRKKKRGRKPYQRISKGLHSRNGPIASGSSYFKKELDSTAKLVNDGLALFNVQNKIGKLESKAQNESLELKEGIKQLEDLVKKENKMLEDKIDDLSGKKAKSTPLIASPSVVPRKLPSKGTVFITDSSGGVKILDEQSVRRKIEESSELKKKLALQTEESQKLGQKILQQSEELKKTQQEIISTKSREQSIIKRMNDLSDEIKKAEEKRLELINKHEDEKVKIATEKNIQIDKVKDKAKKIKQREIEKTKKIQQEFQKTKDELTTEKTKLQQKIKRDEKEKFIKSYLNNNVKVADYPEFSKKYGLRGIFYPGYTENDSNSKKKLPKPPSKDTIATRIFRDGDLVDRLYDSLNNIQRSPSTPSSRPPTLETPSSTTLSSADKEPKEKGKKKNVTFNESITGKELFESAPEGSQSDELSDIEEEDLGVLNRETSKTVSDIDETSLIGDGDKNKGLYNTQIEKIMSPFHKYGFCGVIPSDKILSLLPKVQRGQPLSFIMNLDKSGQPGSHWVAVYLDPEESLEYYDSFGREPPEQFNKDILHIVNKVKPNIYLKYKINKIVDQSSSTGNCGWFCIKFLINRYKGVPFKECTGYNNFKIGEKDIESFKKKYNTFEYI